MQVMIIQVPGVYLFHLMRLLNTRIPDTPGRHHNNYSDIHKLTLRESKATPLDSKSFGW